MAGFHHLRPLVPITVMAVALAGCSSSERLGHKVDPRYGVATSPRVVELGQPVPKGGGVYRVGKPYTIAGREYIPEENIAYRADGVASWYGEAFHGRLTANGEVFDMGAISAAHPTLPMPSYVRVTSLANRRSIVVRVNDRGPFHSDRIIDLSTRAADLLGFRGNGVARVRVEYLGRAPLEGSDDRILQATLRDGDPAPHPAAIQVASLRASAPLRAQPLRGAVPVPQSRPFSLGDTQPEPSPEVVSRSAALPQRSTVARAEPLRPTSDSSGMAASPVTAFLPIPAAENASTGLLFGRGLY